MHAHPSSLETFPKTCISQGASYTASNNVYVHVLNDKINIFVSLDYNEIKRFDFGTIYKLYQDRFMTMSL